MNHNEQALKEKDCACRNLRMASRVITQLYDEALSPVGLKASQFSLLSEIAYREMGISVNDLAKVTMMDQTTATRNLLVLEKHQWVITTPSPQDGRKKVVIISESGMAVLNEAKPYWSAIQQRVLDTLGDVAFDKLLHLLDTVKRMD